MYFSLRVTLMCLLLIVQHTAIAAAWNDTYEFGNDCPILTKDLTEYDEIYVEYNGKDVSSSCNKFKFRGRGEKSLDEYSICVTPLYFNDRTCAVEVDIMTSFSAEATEKITCTDIKRYKYCGLPDDTLSIVFKSTHGRSADDASFMLLVTATKGRDEMMGAGFLIVPLMILVVGGLFAMISSTSKLCLCVCRRNQLFGRLMVLEPGNRIPGTGYVLFSGPPDLSKMTTTDLVSPQGVYQVSLNPQPVQYTDTLPAANQWTDAPPKYEELTDVLTHNQQNA